MSSLIPSRSLRVFTLIGLVTLSGVTPATAARDIDGSRSNGDARPDIVMPHDPGALAPGATAFPTVEKGNGWRPLKLYGGSVSQIAVSPVDPNLVLTGNGYFIDSNYGVFVSRDGGRTWNKNPLPPGTYDNHFVTDIEFAPDGTPYILSYDALLRGNKNATSWETITAAPGVFAVYYGEIVLNPKDPREIWVTTLQQLAAGNEYVLMRTTDGGATWTDVPISMPQYYGFAGIALNRNDPSNMVVALSDGTSGRVMYSLNGGGRWVIGVIDGRVSSLVIRDVIHDGTRFYMCGGIVLGTNNLGVYVSNDGVRWEAEHTELWPTRNVRDLDFDPAQPGLIIAATDRGIFRRENNTWSFGTASTGSHTLLTVALTPNAPGRILAGVINHGVLRSEDDGAHFEASSRGLMLLDVKSVASNPVNPQELAASFDSQDRGGVYTSVDGGENWTLAPLPGLGFGPLEYGPDGVLYAATPWKRPGVREGIYRRNADGSWTHLGLSDNRVGCGNKVFSIDVSRINPDLIFATTYNYCSFMATVWRSTDGGASWSQVLSRPSTLFNDVQIADDGTDRNILLARSSVGGVSVSRDGGDTWSASPGIAEAARPTSMRGTPADPLTFYLAVGDDQASDAGKSYRTLDGGDTWDPLAGTDYLYMKLEVDRIDPDVVYALRDGFPFVMRSMDGGDTFKEFDAGLAGATPQDLAWQEGPCPTLLLATDSGVFVRTIDSAAPQVSVTLEPNVLWPPNNKLRTIHARVTTHDACDASPRFELKSIVAEEGAASGDIVAKLGEGTTTFQLRASKSGKGERRYVVKFAATDASGNTSEVTGVVRVPHDQSGIQASDEATSEAKRTAIVSIAPNPFNPSTVVTFTLDRAQPVALEVYGVDGARVRSLSSGTLPAGAHRAAWDGLDDAGNPAASGVYFFRLATPNRTLTMKALLVK